MSIRKGNITTKEIENVTPYLSDIKGFPVQCPGMGFIANSHHAIIIVSDITGKMYGILEATRSFTNSGVVEIINLWETSSQYGSFESEYRLSKRYNEDEVKAAFAEAKKLMEDVE
jgi:hypothetical protein